MNGIKEIYPVVTCEEGSNRKDDVRVGVVDKTEISCEGPFGQSSSYGRNMIRVLEKVARW